MVASGRCMRSAGCHFTSDNHSLNEMKRPRNPDLATRSCGRLANMRLLLGRFGLFDDFSLGRIFLAIDDHGDLRAKFADQMDGDMVLTGGADRFVEHNLSAVDLGADDTTQTLGNIVGGDRTVES